MNALVCNEMMGGECVWCIGDVTACAKGGEGAGRGEHRVHLGRVPGARSEKNSCHCDSMRATIAQSALHHDRIAERRVVAVRRRVL